MSCPPDDTRYDRYLALVRRHLPYAAADELDRDTALSDYGFDSHGVIRLVVAIEAEFAIEIPDDRLTIRTLYSLGSLWSTVQPLLS